MFNIQVSHPFKSIRDKPKICLFLKTQLYNVSVVVDIQCV